MLQKERNKQTKIKLLLVTIAKRPPGRAGAEPPPSASPQHPRACEWCCAPALGIDGIPGPGAALQGMLSARGRGKALPCKGLGPGGSQLLCACVQAEGGTQPYGRVPPSAWMSCRHECISFFAFFFFLDLFKQQVQKGFVFPGARDLLPLIWCRFFGGGRTGRDLVMGQGGGGQGER